MRSVDGDDRYALRLRGGPDREATESGLFVNVDTGDEGEGDGSGSSVVEGDEDVVRPEGEAGDDPQQHADDDPHDVERADAGNGRVGIGECVPKKLRGQRQHTADRAPKNLGRCPCELARSVVQDQGKMKAARSLNA